MLIREYTDADLGALRALHAAQSLPYAFPDLANPLFLTRLVAVRDDGAGAPHAGLACGFSSAAPRDSEILAAVFLRLTAEAYFVLDPRAGTPRDRWRALLMLH
ncbi:MAG: hypothetical protein WAM91_14465, partial [Candidatus Acidiferrales bacterium]